MAKRAWGWRFSGPDWATCVEALNRLDFLLHFCIKTNAKHS